MSLLPLLMIVVGLPFAAATAAYSAILLACWWELRNAPRPAVTVQPSRSGKVSSASATVDRSAICLSRPMTSIAR
ncbi:hypothetical protein [Nocardia bhagyanarayanae]|uniref:Uncharacterized protein n=1 Tax=Nocardia bhagyanarayanae TaxID=1215925 RepID=A0A543FDH7_9NOCA|nr:hypothetical protein [Nocardia bhagyanarayanae]TQM31930.1 hypothetical protein FB390_3600 [Nocardia bhagyanarayanae]